MIAIFESQAILDAVLPLPSGVEIGEPLQSQDGRVAISHGFTDEDQAVLTEAGATLAEALPTDWKYLDSEI